MTPCFACEQKLGTYVQNSKGFLQIARELFVHLLLKFLGVVAFQSYVPIKMLYCNTMFSQSQHFITVDISGTIVVYAASKMSRAKERPER